MLNTTAVQNWLNAPIPRKRALTSIGIMFVGNLANSAYAAAHIRRRRQTHETNLERFYALRESLHYLLDKADPETVAEVNEKLEYWRQVLGD